MKFIAFLLVLFNFSAAIAAQNPTLKLKKDLNLVKLLIFDFDGTLCDSYNTFVHALNEGSTQFGYKKLSPDKIASLKDKSFLDLFKEMGITSAQIPDLVNYLRSEFTKKIDSEVPFKGMDTALSDLNARGYRFGILTSNSVENALRFNKKHQLADFDFVQSVGISGKDAAILEILKSQNLTKAEALYVGDETRDVQASKKAGIPVVAVTWGFNSKKALIQESPDFVVDEPRELPLIF